MILFVTFNALTSLTQECAVYWPTQTAEKCNYGPFEVELVNTVSTEKASVTERELKLSKSSRVRHRDNCYLTSIIFIIASV